MKVVIGLQEIIASIERHHEQYPDHGRNCSCMDAAIQEMRRMFIAVNPKAQARIDYVIRSALERYP